MTQLALVPEDKSEWLRCRPWFVEAVVLCRGTHSIEDIEQGIEDGTYRFFSMPNCAVVARIIEYPRKKCLNYFLAGGDLDEIKDKMEPYLTTWAKSQGCSIVTLVGRDGWIRSLKPLGWHKGWSAAYKEI